MRYTVEIYCGRVYCGNGFFDTLDECYKFAKEDGFCDRMKVYDSFEDKIITIKI